MFKLGFLIILIKIGTCEYIRGCYYTNWAQYRQDRGKYMPSDYKPGLCTHVYYGFAVMNPDFTIKPFEWNDEDSDWSVGMYSKVISWKKQQPGLKVLLSFGGWTFSEGNVNLLREMASTQKNRNVFIKSIIQLLQKYKFDGFDLDWEYPNEQDKADFALLLQDIRKAFDATTPKLLFTAAVTPNYKKIDMGYNISVLTRSLDMLNVMTYDFHGAWEMVTGHNSPLYDRQGDKFSISDAVEAWASKGFPKSKMSVGVAAYGRGWTLASSDTKIGAQASGPSTANLYTKQPGMISYYEVCDYLAKGAQRFFDHEQVSPFIVSGNQWYSYDDVESINIKLNWIKQNGYAGAFFWALDLDDFNGKCPNGQGKVYPLVTLMKSILNNDKESSDTVAPITRPLTSPEPVDATTVPIFSSSLVEMESTLDQSTPSPKASFTCPGAGLFPDSQSCIDFYNCDNSGSYVKIQCPGGLLFNPTAKICDWPYNVKCKGA